MKGIARQNGTVAAQSIDLNSDLGESFGRRIVGDDASMFGIVTSANIACGFHAGDPATILASCRVASQRGVVVGAHPSYPDLPGFGRRDLDVAPDDLYADLMYQFGAIESIARAAGTRVRYVKPHGALYNRAVVDDAVAKAIARAVREFDESLPVLGLAGSALERATDAADVQFRKEAFADRAVLPDGTLAPRGVPGALITDPAVATQRAVRLATSGEVVAVDGSVVAMATDSICVHGDTPDAVAIALAVRAGLTEAGITLEAFA